MNTAGRLVVESPGFLSTVQDRGRPGFGAFGIAPAGALDPFALLTANRLVGNADDAPALELVGSAGLRIEAPPEGLWVALTGGGAAALVERGTTGLLPRGRATCLHDGAHVQFAARSPGARAVLAVAGGIVRAQALGSASTDVQAGLGAALRAGERVGIAPSHARPQILATESWRYLEHAVYGARGPGGADRSDAPVLLRYVPDPAASPRTTTALARATWRVSPHSNRVGYQLLGPALPAFGSNRSARGGPAEPASEPVPPGTLQLPPAGTPILLLAEGPTVGGYPRLGALTALDTPRAAQLRPGDHLRLAPIAVNDAQDRLRARAATLNALLPPTG